MKWLLSIVFLLSLHGLSLAQAPRMTVRDDDGKVKFLRLEHAKVSVQFVGDVAQTVLDLEFRNDGERAVEGEFALALPEGATVSGYALDVNGNMREGVVVEKQRARNAYESVKRRMIDPGIVEREAGNIYRTKVYPVPAKGTKRLSIRYLETLRTSARVFEYSLPLDFPDTLLSFSCEITGSEAGELSVIENAGLEFGESKSGKFRAELVNARPRGVLKLSLKRPVSARIILENHAQPAFYLSDPMPEMAPRPRPKPSHVIIVWDASASGNDRDHKKEFALMDAWFAKLGNTRVKLRLLRDRLEDGGEFEIRNGRWQKLKETLQQVDYDGATFFDGVKFSSQDADLVLLVSDGISTIGSGKPEISSPWVLIHSGSVAAGKPFFQWAKTSAEAIINLASETNQQAMAKLTNQSLRLIAVEGEQLGNFFFEPPQTAGEPLRIFGNLKADRAGKLQLRYGFGNQVTTTREVSYQPGGDADGIVRRLHAQRVLVDLEQQSAPNQKRIIDHCMSHGLVSDYTSFIVLELLQDYADHGIRPPEAELQGEYNQLIAKRDARRQTDLGGLAVEWSEKLAWYNRRFPGYEALILPRVKQVGIWKKAVEAQFAPAQRDAKSFATIAGWFDKANALIAEKAKLKTKENYQNWQKAIDDLHEQGPELSQTPIALLPEGQSLAVSVRGLVAKPGVITATTRLSLREAITMAGGLHPSGSLDNVALYRNAGKVVYNTLSEQFKDFHLSPGDMVVVGQQHYTSYDGAADPFAADPFGPAPDPIDPSKQNAVREQGDVWVVPSVSQHHNDPIGASDDVVAINSGAFPVTPATPTSIRMHEPLPKMKMANLSAVLKPRRIEGETAGDNTGKDNDSSDAYTPDFVAFEKALATGLDAEIAYRKLKANHVYQDRFYIEVARLLVAKKQPLLARRVLSNIVEFRSNDLSAMRAYAFWLAEFGQTEEAVRVLTPLCENDSATLTLHLDLASIQATRGNAVAIAETLVPALADIHSNQSGSLAALALTEYNALDVNSCMRPIGWQTGTYYKNLAADIRIVAISTGDGNSLRFSVEEPSGFDSSLADTPSPTGGRVSMSGGRREYMIRRAIPGIYKITCASDHPATVRLVLHTRWGYPDQKSKVVTLLLDNDRMQQVGEIEYEFHLGESK
jgi:Vault protein inter-alpha-trypsin domain/SLBB domain